ncbi:MAG: hypothetical protein GY713_20915, partial [Actinomycetia bacterium]|nr:hypothetical protein [Actinomycetes bacterium]
MLIFTDDSGDNTPMHVGAFAIYDGALTPAEVTALGVAGDPISGGTPSDPPVVTVQAAGPATAVAGTSDDFDFLATDPEAAEVRIQVDWGNGVLSGWTTAGPSGVTQTIGYAYPAAGSFTIKARARDTGGATSDWVTLQSITVSPDPNNPPAVTVQAAGPATAVAGTSDDFDFLATDPESDDVEVQVDWGNGVISGWTTAGTSGVVQTVAYAYPASGSFDIKARARDTGGATSDWEDIQAITVDPGAEVPNKLVGLWEFDDADDLGKATVGTDLTIGGTAPTYSATLADDSSDSLSGVITTNVGSANFLTATHGIAANGGGSNVNQYSVVFDVFSPAGSRGSWRTFFQTDA